jgi:antitoxin ParD1/3/4
MFVIPGILTGGGEGAALVNISLTPELERFVQRKVSSGLYNNASEVIREGLRLLKEHDEDRLRWREQIERGWRQARAGDVMDGSPTVREIENRLKSRAKKRA